MTVRPLRFNAFIWPSGYHESAWRVVDDDVHGVLGSATTPTSRVSPSGA
jgi:N-acetyl-S-(2-succino)cysteine monooxygenase